MQHIYLSPHYDDIERQNSMNFYVCKEINRIKPTGTEWSKWNTPDNQYELVEVTVDETKNISLKTDAIKDKIIEIFEDSICN